MYDAYLNEGWPTQTMGLSLEDILKDAIKGAGEGFKDKTISSIVGSQTVQDSLKSEGQKAAAASMADWLLENKKMLLIGAGLTVGFIAIGIFRR